MALLLALAATVLTSFLPIVNKRLLRDTSPAYVAWIINAASLPLLGAGAVVLTQCPFRWDGGVALACTWHWPHADGIFFIALLASVALNGAATLLSTHAPAQAEMSAMSQPSLSWVRLPRWCGPGRSSMNSRRGIGCWGRR